MSQSGGKLLFVQSPRRAKKLAYPKWVAKHEEINDRILEYETNLLKIVNAYAGPITHAADRLRFERILSAYEASQKEMVEHLKYLI